MDFIAKKYTILMNDEPVDLWLKNGKVKRSIFMDKEVILEFNAETIKQIRDYPTRLVNGNNFKDNIDFTKKISKMMSKELEGAISKKNFKILSRFARSDLIPQNMQNDFLEAINHPHGLRGLLITASNKTNAILQGLAKKIDRYFEKINDNIANQKFDKYLSEYQLKSFNKAPPLQYLDTTKRLDAKVMNLAEEFIEKRDIRSLDEGKISDQVKINDFLTQSSKRGISVTDSKIALAKILEEKMTKKDNFNLWLQKEAYLNNTLSEYSYIINNCEPNISKERKLDLLLQNKEYKSFTLEEKDHCEKTLIYTQEPVKERAKEVKEIAKIFDTQQKIETVQERISSIKFNSEPVKKEVFQKWSELQKINREQKAQNRDFMNISIVRFGGVSVKSLNNWKNSVLQNSKADSKTIDKFVDATIRNAKELTKIGILRETIPGEYKFTDDFSKESLYKNLDKTIEQIATVNRGKTVEIESTSKTELQDRVQQLSSEKSFDALIGTNGEIDSQKLHDYAKKLELLATQLHQQEKANIVTRDDLKKVDKAYEQQKIVGAERC